MSFPSVTQKPSYSSIDEFVQLKAVLHQAADKQPNVSQTASISLRERIEHINQCTLNGTKPELQDVEISPKEVADLNKEMRESKEIRKKAWTEIKGIKKFGMGFLRVVTFGLYKGYVPQIKVSKFTESVNNFHTALKQERLSKGVEAPTLKQEEVGVKASDKCFRPWRNADNYNSYMVTIADGTTRKDYRCNFQQLNEGKILLENPHKPEDTITIKNPEFKQLVALDTKDPKKLAEGTKKLTETVEKALERALNIKPYGKMQLENLLNSHVVQGQNKDGLAIPARMRKCEAQINSAILAVTRSGDQFKISVCNTGNVNNIFETTVNVDTQGRVTWGNETFVSVEAFKERISKAGVFLDNAETQINRSTSAKQAIDASRKVLWEGAQKLGIDNEPHEDIGLMTEIESHLKQLPEAKAGGVVRETSDPSKFFVIAAVEGKAQKFLLEITDSGAIQFRGKTYAPKTQISEILKDTPILPMDKARAEFTKEMSALEKVCYNVKSDQSYYGYYSSLKKFDDFEKFFPDKSQLKGTWAINPGKAPQPVVAAPRAGIFNKVGGAFKDAVLWAPKKMVEASQAVYDYVIPDVVNQYLTKTFDEFTLSVHDGARLHHYEVTIDVNNTEGKPYAYKTGEIDGKPVFKNYAKPEDILKEHASGIQLSSYKALDAQQKRCKDFEKSIRSSAGFTTENEFHDWAGELDLTEGDYAIFETKPAGTFELHFMQGKGDDCKGRAVVCSTRTVPGQLTIVEEKSAQGDGWGASQIVSTQFGKSFVSPVKYLAAIGLVPEGGVEFRPVSAKGRAHDEAQARIRAEQGIAASSQTSFEESPIIQQQPADQQLLREAEVSSRLDYMSDNAIKGLARNDKVNKYCFTWDSDDGAELRLYDNTGISTSITIKRQGDKYSLEDDAQLYGSLDEILRAKKGGRLPFGSAQPLTTATIAQRPSAAVGEAPKQAPLGDVFTTAVRPDVQSEPVKSPVKVEQPPSAKAEVTLPDIIGISLSKEKQQVGRRLNVAYNEVNGRVNDLSKDQALLLLKEIIAEGYADTYDGNLNKRMEKVLTWTAKDMEKMQQITEKRAFLTALKAKAGI